MKCAVLLVLLCSVVYSKALECGIAKVNFDETKETLKSCVKDQKSFEDIWEMVTSGMSSTESKESNSTSMEEGQSQSKNARKTRDTGRIQGTKIEVKERRGQKDIPLTNSTERSSEENTDTTTSSSTESDCFAQCIIDRLKLADDNGHPDHAKVVKQFVDSAPNRELRVFAQETADECFQQVDQESNLDSCDHATKLMKCFADRARTNCSDWPAGNLPF